MIYKCPQIISCKWYITRANINWKWNLFIQENKNERGGGIYYPFLFCILRAIIYFPIEKTWFFFQTWGKMVRLFLSYCVIMIFVNAAHSGQKFQIPPGLSSIQLYDIRRSGTMMSSTYKTNLHDNTIILLKFVLSTYNPMIFRAHL
jgi:hypothetical protein